MAMPTPPPSQEIALRSSPVSAIALLVVGALLVATEFLPDSGMPIGMVAGIIMMIAGVLQLVGKYAVITPQEVQLKNPFGMTIKRHRINGLGDLAIDGKTLRRLGDNKKVASVSPLVAKKDDVETLGQAIAATRGY